MILLVFVLGFMLGIITMGYYCRLLIDELFDSDDWVDAEEIFERLGYGKDSEQKEK